MVNDRITDAQRAALAKLAPLLPADAYLVGGIAVTAHLGHRTSRDLDLFSRSDPTAVAPALEMLPGVVIESRSHGTLHIRIDGIPASMIEYRYELLDRPVSLAGLPISVASLTDLACMKMSAIASRGAARDFWDLHAIIGATEGELSPLLDAFRRKFPVDDLGHVLKSLVYFGDAETAPLPTGLSDEHWMAIRADFELWIRPSIAE